ncbi:hypothetical protein CARG_04020 [Corynebacterium argentoratense DSM 44202]|uniref:Uncharacterized protein n=1 Tax=Corynebacterium argentoratense DSM 44202 TaxID=1348662 RepID=U3GXV7_9CORY|nr:hypothetical protein CARG_04020 [Corynebacterium argentoratense DSM 44202]
MEVPREGFRFHRDAAYPLEEMEEMKEPKDA